jgi:hypothetical protein
MITRALALNAILALAACSDDPVPGAIDAAPGAPDAAPGVPDAAPGLADAAPGAPDAAPGAPDAGAAHNLEIWVRGDLTPRVFADGLSGQTPTSYTIGLASYQLLRSADDPAPATVFDHGDTPVDVDLLGETLAGTAASADLPPATYGYGRIRMTKVQFTVDMTAHYLGFSIPGTLTVTGALSDTVIDGEDWPMGRASYRFTAAGYDVTQPGTLPPFPSTGGGTVYQDDEGTWMLFPFPTPLVIADTPASHRATIIYQVYQSFRWQDQELTGYAAGVFDGDSAAGTTEPVLNIGATGYAIEID